MFLRTNQARHGGDSGECIVSYAATIFCEDSGCTLQLTHRVLCPPPLFASESRCAISAHWRTWKLRKIKRESQDDDLYLKLWRLAGSLHPCEAKALTHLSFAPPDSLPSHDVLLPHTEAVVHFANLGDDRHSKFCPLPG